MRVRSCTWETHLQGTHTHTHRGGAETRLCPRAPLAPQAGARLMSSGPAGHRLSSAPPACFTGEKAGRVSPEQVLEPETLSRPIPKTVLVSGLYPVSSKCQLFQKPAALPSVRARVVSSLSLPFPRRSLWLARAGPQRHTVEFL